MLIICYFLHCPTRVSIATSHDVTCCILTWSTRAKWLHEAPQRSCPHPDAASFTLFSIFGAHTTLSQITVYWHEAAQTDHRSGVLTTTWFTVCSLPLFPHTKKMKWNCEGHDCFVAVLRSETLNLQWSTVLKLPVSLKVSLKELQWWR